MEGRGRRRSRALSRALYGAQTRLAVANFALSGLTMPRPFLRALGFIKGAAARVNRDLGLLDAARAAAIEASAREVASGRHDDQFPIDVFQTGSGTSTNMNANEVIATLATARLGRRVHPNDHVNLGQSSNDVIPSAIHVAASLEIHASLLPALERLAGTIEARARGLHGVVKSGRTHLMDALPLRLGQELGGWAAQVRGAAAGVRRTLPRLHALALGGTAVGTGANTHPQFGRRAAARLARTTGIAFRCGANHFQDLSGQDAAVEMSGQLRACAVVIMKIANDLRWMNSGPFAGLAEIRLPALQAGSSIMPGKTNPVIPEAAAMACVQVLGHDVSIAVAGQSGSFQLNTMLPLVAWDLLASIRLLAGAARALADRAIAGFEVNTDRIAAALAANPTLVTALNPLVGYDRSAAIAERTRREGRSLLDVAHESTGLDRRTLARMLDPRRLTGPGVPGPPAKRPRRRPAGARMRRAARRRRRA